MANYNSGRKYNVSPKEPEGFNYNSAEFSIVFKIGENLNMSEEVKITLARFILNEIQRLTDTIDLKAYFSFTGNLIFQAETYQQTALMSVIETLNVKDLMTSLVVSQLLEEKVSLFEQINLLSEILVEENIPFGEKLDLKTLFNLAESFNLPEISNLVATILAYQELNIIDRDPKTAISDFYIRKSADGAFDILMPFGFKIDWGKTLINFMPEAVDSSVELPGIDGEFVQDTVYKARNFDIVAYSDAGITNQEREYLKTKIANTLELIKTSKKKLTIGNANTSFDVKYSGAANIDDSRGNYVKLELPLKVTNPYGYGEFEGSLKGSGLMVNSGIIPTGPRIEIKGPFVNANISIGSKLLSWQGTILINEKLVIDCEQYLCYKIDANRNKSNAMTGFNGNFVKVDKGSIVIECNQNIEALTTFYWKEKFLWGNHNETF